MSLLEACRHSNDMPRSPIPVRVFLVDDSVLIRGRVADLLVAGGMAIVGLPYCADHAAIAYVRPKEEKAKAA